LVKEVPLSARKLAEKFWPGPLTMVMPKSELVPDVTSGGLDTVQADEHFTPEEIGRMTRMKRTRLELSENGDNVFSEAVASLKREVLGKKLSEKEMSLEDLDDFLAARRRETAE